MLAPRLATVSTAIAAPPPKLAEPFYVSAPWKALMSAIRRERGDRCQDCGRSGVRIFGDHIVELKDGGAKLDPRNIFLRCGSCHSKKTAVERAKRTAIKYS